MLIVFWVCTGFLVYTYFGYPLLLGALARLIGRQPVSGDLLPSVTVLVAAYQEAEVIGDKIENFKALDYPPERIDLLVVSDGSTDGTDEIVERCGGDRVRLLRQEPRQGKACALRRGIPEATGEIVLFTDANVLFARDAVRRLVRPFVDPAVGVVTGTVHLVDDKPGYARSEGLYYRYERFLQRNESTLWSVVGVDGALYAVRRSLIELPPPDAILDDFVISMQVARKGKRIIYVPEARAQEDAAPGIREEFRRKVRVATGAFQTLLRRWAVPGLQPVRLMFCYVSHKLLRWLAPVGLVGILLISAWLASQRGGWWWGIAGGQALGYAVAGAALYWPVLRSLPLVGPAMYFAMMNAAFLVGLWKACSGVRSGAWAPTARRRLSDVRGSRG